MCTSLAGGESSPPFRYTSLAKRKLCGSECCAWRRGLGVRTGGESLEARIADEACNFRGSFRENGAAKETEITKKSNA
jgi:hypothetical protein